MTDRTSLYRTAFLTAAVTAGLVLLGVLTFLMSSRDSAAPTLADGGAVTAAAVPVRIPTRVEYRDDLAFFDPVSGNPAIWFHKLTDGSYDLFDAAGFHPTYGKEAPLQTVTPMIVGDIKAYFQKDQEPVRRAAARPASRPALRQRIQQSVAAPRVLESQSSLAPVARSIAIPAGTRLDVILGQRLSTATNSVGENFEATLARPVIIVGETVLEQGATVTGRITDLERPGQVSGVAKLTLTLIGVYAEGENNVSLQTAPLTMEGKSTKAKDAAKVGIVTAIGATIGGLFGGGKGAAKGAAIGAGGGAGMVVATRGEELVLAPEQELTFTLARNVNIR